MLDYLKEHIDNKYINVGIHDLDNNYKITNSSTVSNTTTSTIDSSRSNSY